MPWKITRFTTAAVLLLVSGYSYADNAYVTDSVTVAVFPSQELKGEPLERLLSGTVVEVLQSTSTLSQVKTVAGNTGWLRSSFLTSDQPAAIRLESVQGDLNKARSELNASKTELAALQKQIVVLKKDAAAAKDLGWMKAELAKARKKAAALEQQLNSQALQSSEVDQETETFEQQLAALEAEKNDLQQRLAAAILINDEVVGFDAGAGGHASLPLSLLIWGIVSLILGLAAGFAACYYWLDRRLRRRFGGVRVY